MQRVNKYFFKCSSAQLKNCKLKPLQSIIFCLSNKERCPEVWIPSPGRMLSYGMMGKLTGTAFSWKAQGTLLFLLLPDWGLERLRVSPVVFLPRFTRDFNLDFSCPYQVPPANCIQLSQATSQLKKAESRGHKSKPPLPRATNHKHCACLWSAGGGRGVDRKTAVQEEKGNRPQASCGGQALSHSIPAKRDDPSEARKEQGCGQTPLCVSSPYITMWREGAARKGPGRQREPRAPGVFDKKAQPFAIAALEMYHTLCGFQAEESSLASWRGARNFTPEPRLGPRNLLMVTWYEGQGSHPQAEQEVGTDGLERTGEKASCPCVPAGGRSGALTAARPGSTALTLLHSGQAESTKCELCPNLGSV